MQQIEIYHRNIVAVENNTKVLSKINAFKATLSKLEAQFQKQHQVLMELSGKRELFRASIEKVKGTIAEVSAMENELNSYQNYMQAVSRDGISFQVICNTCPEIEREVNSILSQIVDFTIQFETDGKNITPYIVYSDAGKWPIELVSGAERFISSMAIRTALNECSNLVRCNFLAIDEGMGTLDATNLSMIPTLFTILKHHYDFIIVVSHLDSIRDAVDKTIEISHEGGFAKVIHE